MFKSKQKWMTCLVLLLLLLSSNATVGRAGTQSYGSYGETGFYGKYEYMTPPSSGHLTEDEKNVLLIAPDEQIKIPAAGDSSNVLMYVLTVITMLASLILYRKLSLNKKIA